MIERSAGTGLDDKNVENVSQATAKILRMLGQQGEVIVLCKMFKSFLDTKLWLKIWLEMDYASRKFSAILGYTTFYNIHICQI